MEFNPNNPIVQLCVRGMGTEENGKPKEAYALFFQAWKEARDDFEKYLGAYYVARHQKNVSERLKWLETALGFASKVEDDGVKSAFPTLYTNIAKCYEELGDSEKARVNFEMAKSFASRPSDKGPFYHGTRADLLVGDLLTPGKKSNYKEDLAMNHIYFTAIVDGAGLAAALAKGDGPERVYIVEPTGEFENDPNVTDKKFPGNPTRSYRTAAPLRVVGEINDWARITPEKLRQWRERLANSKGQIIN